MPKTQSNAPPPSGHTTVEKETTIQYKLPATPILNLRVCYNFTV